MENKRAILWSVVAAVVAALAYFLSVEKAVDNRVGNLDKRELILVANRDIPAETRIDLSMLKEVSWPSSFLPPKYSKIPQEVVGQVALATIFENEPVLTSKLVPFDETSIDRRIPDGYRAVTIGIRDDQDVVGVGGLLRPGNFVDILITHFINTQEIENSNSGSAASILNASRDKLKAEVRTVFQNIKILAVGRDMRIQTANVNRAASSQQNLTNKNITVALKPKDVQTLVLAQQTGRITLALRKFNDTEIMDLDYLDPFRAFGIKLPVVQGPPPAYREIRGGQVIASPF